MLPKHRSVFLTIQITFFPFSPGEVPPFSPPPRKSYEEGIQLYLTKGSLILAIPDDYLVHVEGPLCWNPGHTWRLSGPGGGPPLLEPWPYLATIWSRWRAPCVGILAIPGEYLVQVEGPLCGNPGHTWRLSGPGGGPPVLEPWPYLATIWSRWRAPSVGTLAIPGDYLVQVEGPLCGNPGHTWRLFGPGGGPL